MSGRVHFLSTDAEHTTARYFEKVVERGGGEAVVHVDGGFDPAALPAEDLLVYVDPASDWPLGLERAPCPTLAYFIDVHQDLASRLRLANFFDAVFIAQKSYVPAFHEAGHAHAYWLPLACDPETHSRPQAARDLDVGFVGKLGLRGSARHETLASVLPRYRTNDYSRFYAPGDMAALYGRSKIVFNASINGDLNMRFFEALASGALLVTDRIDNGLPELFREGVHYVGYSDVSEAIARIDYYLANAAEREAIAKAGFEEAISKHTYALRWSTLLQQAGRGSNAALARTMPPSELSDLYAAIFVNLRRPARIGATIRRYGLTASAAAGLATAWARWANTKVPMTPNAVRARIGMK